MKERVSYILRSSHHLHPIQPFPCAHLPLPNAARLVTLGKLGTLSFTTAVRFKFKVEREALLSDPASSFAGYVFSGNGGGDSGSEVVGLMMSE